MNSDITSPKEFVKAGEFTVEPMSANTAVMKWVDLGSTFPDKNFSVAFCGTSGGNTITGWHYAVIDKSTGSFRVQIYSTVATTSNQTVQWIAVHH